MTFYLLAALLAGMLFSAPALGQADKTVNGYAVAATNLTLEFNGAGNIVAVKETVGKVNADKLNEGFQLTDGKSNQAIALTGVQGRIEGRQLVFSGQDAAKELNAQMTFAPVREHLSCKLTLKNVGKEQKWIYVRFALPVIYAENRNYWNGSVTFKEVDTLNVTKRIGNGFPMACVYGKASGLALGIEGHQMFSWLDTGINTESQKHFFWAVKLVLDPGQEDGVEFIAYAFPNDYGFLNAVDVYHRAFPDLFEPAPGIDPRAVYGNCACGYSCWSFCLDLDKEPQRELLRRAFCTWEWMYAPFKRSGDILCKDEFWDWGNKSANENGVFKGTAGQYREKGRSLGFYRADKYYIMPMFYVINWAEEKLAKEVYPGSCIHDPDGLDRIDPWVHGYLCSVRTYMWGNKFTEATQDDQRAILKEPLRYLGGFAVDCAAGEERHRGDGLNQSPGRAYDKDGVFVSEGIGQAKWFDFMHGLKSGDRPMAIVSNGGDAHYLTAFRTDTVIEECGAMNFLTNPKSAEAGQLLMGRKPRCIYQGNYYTDRLGEQVDWKNMTPDQIHEVYRTLFKSYVLLGFKNNFFYSADLAVGSENILRSMPAHLELSRAGWQAIPSVQADPGLWLTRYGQGPTTYLFLGNPSTDKKQGQATVDHRYLGDAKFVFTTFTGQETANEVVQAQTKLNYAIDPKEYVIFKCALALQTKGDFQATASEQTTCDQSLVKVALQNLAGPIAAAARVPRGMIPESVTLDGKPLTFKADADAVTFTVTPMKQSTLEMKFRSEQILSPEKQILDLPIYDEAQAPVCKVVLGANPTEYDREIGWWVQDYFKVYCRNVEQFKIKISAVSFKDLTDKKNLVVISGDDILPEMDQIEPGTSSVLSSHPKGAIKVIGSNVLVVYAKADQDRRAMVGRLLRIWDKKYVYYGGLTVPGVKGLGSEPQSIATREMRKKANVLGKVVDSSLAPIPSAGELAVDKRALFLAHFNEKVDADFAKGTAEHAKGNAGITKGKQGKYGEALICAKGMATNLQGIAAPYAQLAFPLDGNLDPKKGTLEFWLKCNFPKKLTAADSQALHYLFDLPTSLTDKNGNVKRMCLVVREYRLAKDADQTEKMFHYSFAGADQEGKEISCKIDWEPGTWHHVEVAWDDEEAILFLDGAKKGSHALSKGLFGAAPGIFKGNFVIGGLFNEDNSRGPEGLIDELRISNKVRHLEDFTP